MGVTVSFEEPDQQLSFDDYTLTFVNQFGRPIPYYDDGDGPFWVYITSTGIERIIRACGENTALEIAYDEMQAIPAEDLWLAYGFDTAKDYHDAITRPGGMDDVELTEGYQYQASSTGTGIVSIDLNGEAIRPVTATWLESVGVTLQIKFKPRT